jgi:GR25 family glycosyltransferase involved in LPS biosynthesis
MPFDIERPEIDVVTKRTENRMKTYIISMMNHHESTVSTRRLLGSINSTKSNLQAFVFPAITPETLDESIVQLFGKSVVPNIDWTYPKTEEENRYDIRSGLQLSYYPTKDLRKRIACTLSHYSLWLHCYQIEEPIMILEHDAFFTKRFDYKDVKVKFTGDILGINDPVGSTRRATIFKDKISGTDERIKVSETPWIDDRMVPQGLAGNSAYIIKPEGAAKLISLTAEHGLWPNDAIMCKQLLPGKLQHVYPFYTKVTGLKSTTSL